MLHRLAPDTHAVRRQIQTGLHGFKYRLMLPASYATLFAGGAFLFVPLNHSQFDLGVGQTSVEQAQR
jgi:hypothetical protein